MYGWSFISIEIHRSTLDAESQSHQMLAKDIHKSHRRRIIWKRYQNHSVCLFTFYHLNSLYRLPHSIVYIFTFFSHIPHSLSHILHSLFLIFNLAPLIHSLPPYSTLTPIALLTTFKLEITYKAFGWNRIEYWAWKRRMQRDSHKNEEESAIRNRDREWDAHHTEKCIIIMDT